jgi:hypothetical protein
MNEIKGDDWEVLHDAIELRVLALGIDLGVYCEKESYRTCQCRARYLGRLLGANGRAVPAILRRPEWVKKLVLESYDKFLDEFLENDPESQREEEEWQKILTDCEEQERKDFERRQCYDCWHGYLGDDEERDS